MWSVVLAFSNDSALSSFFSSLPADDGDSPRRTMLPVLTAATGRLTTHIILQSKVKIRMGFPNKLGKWIAEKAQKNKIKVLQDVIDKLNKKANDFKRIRERFESTHLERKKIYEGHAKGADMRPPLVAEVRVSHSKRSLSSSHPAENDIRKLFVFLIWFAYLLADWSTNYTISQISDTQDEEDGDQGWTLCALLAPMNDVRSKRSE
ncbi:hypothetical protein Bca52824_033464 [Brassica carinata]|uniref:Uncharacterized protein n=1 Tax=Brassica carinata TaxID=52824 RepID=A0A8X7SEJ1_BRACI|nr:hypothetical protein Bca52824_033464 [Brassica carinata]